jgi:hypothetical protein
MLLKKSLNDHMPNISCVLRPVAYRRHEGIARCIGNLARTALRGTQTTSECASTPSKKIQEKLLLPRIRLFQQHRSGPAFPGPASDNLLPPKRAVTQRLVPRSARSVGYLRIIFRCGFRPGTAEIRQKRTSTRCGVLAGSLESNSDSAG